MKKTLLVSLKAAVAALLLQLLALPVIMAAASAPVITVTPETGEAISHVYSVNGVAVNVADSDGDLGAYTASFYWSRSSDPDDELSSVTPGMMSSSTAEDFTAYAPYPLEGKYYLHITSEDLAGSKTVKTAGPYNIDAGVAPVVEFLGGDAGIVQESHTVTLLVHDFSGLSTASYARWIKLNDDGSETTYPKKNVKAGTAYAAPSMVGRYKLEVYVQDKMGNHATFYSDVFDVGHADGSPIIVMSTGDEGDSPAPSGSLMQMAYIYDDGAQTAGNISVYYKWSQDGENQPQEADWTDRSDPDAFSSSYFSIFNPDPNAFPDGTWYCWVKAVDPDGNASVKRSSAKLLDLNPPEIQVTYFPSLDHPTAGPVSTFFDYSEPITWLELTGATEWVPLSEMGAFSENGSKTFEADDFAGNTGSVTATVTNIDASLPMATVTYSTTDETNGAVTAVVSAESGCYLEGFPEGASVTQTISVDGQDLPSAFSHVFDANGGIEYKIINPSAQTEAWGGAVVNWIDRVPPEIAVYYTENTDATGRYVTAQVDKWLDPYGDLNWDRLPADHVFRENGTWDFTVYDYAGNSATVTAVVDWLSPPEPSVSFSRTTTGSVDPVTASVSFPDAGGSVYILGQTGINTFDVTFDHNERRDFTYIDDHGNSGSVSVIVDWIGNNFATIDYSTTESTSDPVTATFVPGEGRHLTVTNNGGSTEKVFDQNGSFEFQYQTLHGGTGTMTAAVSGRFAALIR